MDALNRQTCAEHAERHALAVCMACRKLLCQECTTQWEGIHYCRDCVGRLAAAPARRGRPLGTMAMLALTVVAALALIRLAVGLGVLMAGMF
ncbi:MAG TPA: B-box zinc finger protein [Thermoanaerobaculia bacterium]|nr:B-box zinc finger protein [Thermoanaerobaculia bacterium]